MTFDAGRAPATGVGTAEIERTSDSLAPNAIRLVPALREIGYSLEQAVADLVDNSINAGAKNFLIRFLWRDDRIVSIAFADDGAGMTGRGLRDAMRLGSPGRYGTGSLGKFGMGLKLASFSQARILTVVSRHAGRSSGRCWNVDEIGADWNCRVLSAKEAAGIYRQPWGPINAGADGTIVLWDALDKLPRTAGGLKATLRAVHKRLDVHLGLHFHRFIERDRLRIHVDQQEIGEPAHNIRVTISPLNPFDYPAPPVADMPSRFRMNIDGFKGKLDLDAHIWPPNSDLPQYRLGNRAAARQGFYFYRNDRLIQAGGWNGLVQHETEPHSSLARVSIDLPANLDAAFSLNVQKSSVIAPNGFAAAAAAATDSKNRTFEAYRSLAQTVYRKRPDDGSAPGVPVPGRGLAAPVRRAVTSVSTTAQTKAPAERPFDFRWQILPSTEYFRIDDNDSIVLNSLYRPDGKEASVANDEPLVKTLLFLLLESDLGRQRNSAPRRRALTRINDVLVAAARLQ